MTEPELIKPDRRRTSHDWYGLVGAALLSAAVSVFATWAAMRADDLNYRTADQQSMVEAQQVTYDRIAKLEDRLDRMYRTIAEQSGTIANLQSQLSAKPDPTAALFAFIEAMDVPAWLKLYEPNNQEFRMFYINSEYERTYRVSRALYIGSTDAQIHSPEQVQQYYQHDMQVIQKKNFREFVELAMVRGKGKITYTTARFWKFHVQLPDGRELVAGVQVGEI